MSEQDRTPGPWTMAYDGVSLGYTILGADERPFERIVARVWASSKERAVANSHLIAAAPELLKALKACLEQLVAYEERGWLGDTWRTRIGLREDIAAARAAIAKAEGRQS